ncbi:MAG: DUF3459 domain-containing protein [Spartobacteria bacterium]|nr:DUF3459 domain-containing protein [Spartobacteria bacterium]
MTKWNLSAACCVALMGISLQAQTISWRPTVPTRGDVIEIQIADCARTGMIHWGINARGRTWQPPDEACWPPHSIRDGVAVDSPFSPPANSDICTLRIGPFNCTTQPVASVDFAVKWDESTWDSNGGKDYHIPITLARIAVEPAAPHLNDRVTVRVKRSRPGGELRWGVNAEHGQWKPPHPGYFPPGSMPSDDGLAVDSPLSAPDTNGISTLVLGPFNNPAQVVTSLHMAVHWGKDWDTDNGRNYNTALSLVDAQATGVLLTEPRPDQTVTNQLNIAFDNTAGRPATLWIDGEPVITLLDPPWECARHVPALAYGPHTLTVQQQVNGATALDSLTFWRVPARHHEPMPADIPQGASVTADGQTAFVLYAPGKHVVSLLGSFNEWNPLTDPMHCDQTGYWWLIKDLPPGRHRYQYLVDGSILIADPYSMDVDWLDEDGEETYEPELAQSVIDTTLPPYTWHDEDFVRPPLNELVIYELFIEDLCPGQGFTGVIARLDYIRDMGFNAIEPLPVIEFSGRGGWGYNPAYHLAPEGSYGTPDELRRLVDAAHQRGIAVIHDAVFNHMCGSAPLYRLYGADYDNSPYFYLFTGENWGMPDIDQESEVSKRYFADVIRHWIEAYHFDGFRYDATRWVGWQGYNDWGASWFAYAGRMADTGVYHIAEHLPTDPDLMNQTEMDAGWHAHYRWRIRDMLVNAKIDANEFRTIMNPLQSGFSNALQRIAYTESHDEERMMFDLHTHGWNDTEAQTRAISSIALTLTSPGIPMIYAGQEFGEDAKKYVGPNPLQWDYLEDPSRRTLHDAMTRLVRLRTSHPALTGQAIRLIEVNQQSDVAVYERYAPEGSVVVACNFGRTPRAHMLTLPFKSAWTRVLSGEIIPEQEGPLMLQLEPGQTVVLAGNRP